MGWFDVEHSPELNCRRLTVREELGQLQKNRERWMELAANEQDPNKLLEIIKEINSLLAQKQDRLAHLPKQDPKLSG